LAAAWYLLDMALDRDYLRNSAATLAASGVFVGTSSWKYPGWRGQFYDSARYEWRGKFAKTRFEKNCLAEYAEVSKPNATNFLDGSGVLSGPFAPGFAGIVRLGLGPSDKAGLQFDVPFSAPGGWPALAPRARRGSGGGPSG
jgi:hypothetical protein